MSKLDYRRIEPVHCAGISIATFLSDDRTTILVSVTDLIEKLSLNVSVDDIECYEYTAYDSIGRAEKHHAILHTELNHLLWMYDCKPSFEFDLEEFRKFFSYEVMSFWNRFTPAAASLSVRDAVRLIDVRSTEYHDKLDIPKGRVYHMAIDALGYTKIPSKDSLTTEELAFVAYVELTYASLAASEQANGVSVSESMHIAESRLYEPLKSLGVITRGVSGA